MAVAVRIESLNKAFGPTRAVDQVSLAIEPGELFFLLGPSGCGKTTLLRCIAGFCEPDSGAIRLGDRDITRVPPHLRDTGMVFQSYALWPHMSVAENVAFGLEMRRLPKSEISKRVAEVLATVKLTDRASHKPNQLSGGQQQRVALARALVVHPQCLLLDEPLSNLDAKLRLEMRAEIRRICKEAGLTAIYVTHDQKEALSIADRLAIFNGGQVQQVGTPQEVYRRPRTAFVAGFIGETNFLQGTVGDRAGGLIVIETPVGRIHSARAPDGPLPAGTTVTVSIRPEVLRLHQAPAGATNLFGGTLHHSMYLGEMAQHQVSLPRRTGGAPGGEITFKAFELSPKTVALDRMEKTSVWIDPADVVVLRE
jgi:iron(III) transport system ATP-binding protein